MFVGHQFVGNLMSLFLLKDGTGGTTSGSGTTLLYIVFVCSMTLGTILMCFLQKRDAKGEETLPDSSVNFYSSIVSLSKSVIAPLFDLQQAFVCMERIYNFKAEYTKYIAEPALGESSVGGAMAVYGAFDAICSLAMGQLTSGLKSITLIVCVGAFIQLTVLLWLLLKYKFLLSVPLCSVTSVALGILYPLLMAAALGIGMEYSTQSLILCLGCSISMIWMSTRGNRVWMSGRSIGRDTAVPLPPAVAASAIGEEVAREVVRVVQDALARNEGDNGPHPQAY
ncbi:hypothetical protein HYC85_008909 [Camellia sinensis]|uniref:Uncharacterized protein n=1 Tax=Camellia sinensis TaxID=4442 RepID=A0A7J7HT80_CAMSI|nr:hypothetical protein HYC85_008909 [Camellia sinensis]